MLLIRLPKNLRSNRWWIIWNHRLFIATRSNRGLSDQCDPSVVPAAWFGSFTHYVSWYLLASPQRRIEASRHAMFVPELGRFGNMTKRLASALATADIMGCGNVIIPRSAEFTGGVYRRGVHERQGRARLWMCSFDGPASLSARVLHKREFLGGPQIDATRHGKESAESWADLQALLVRNPARAALPASHLVIHLRGGDVFGTRKPKSYGQPPLAFYVKLLDSEYWSAVTVVHQDEKNPVLEPLLETCSAREIPATAHSGAVVDDIAELLRASTLVAGRGTFMPAVVGLSRNVKRVFYFHDKFTLHPPVSGVDIIRISDAEGSYVRDVLSNNWENSDFQRNLMLTYPQSNLEFSTLD
jgi:hypothetical protein